MSNRHELKTLPVYFQAVARGDKTFELRVNDRDFQTGDTVVLKEWNPGFRPAPVTPAIAPYPAPPQPPALPAAPGYYTGEEIEATITYTSHGGRFGLEPNHVIFGFRDTIYSNDKD